MTLNYDVKWDAISNITPVMLEDVMKIVIRLFLDHESARFLCYNIKLCLL